MSEDDRILWLAEEETTKYPLLLGDWRRFLNRQVIN